ncbi:MAG: FAD-binding protein [Candidatus Moduliflexus flocculans]|nr:FAD-binding protein [Candidatus Moduliflexus flocculans]
MTGERLDAVVVGASLAGSAAALVLARSGARVAVVDKATVPAAEDLRRASLARRRRRARAARPRRGRPRRRRRDDPALRPRPPRRRSGSAAASPPRPSP